MPALDFDGDQSVVDHIDEHIDELESSAAERYWRLRAHFFEERGYELHFRVDGGRSEVSVVLPMP